MLVENQKIETKWSTRTKEWYINRGYKFTKLSDKFLVDAKDLSKGSHIKIKVQCDYCNRIIEVVWKDYYPRMNHDKYACDNCRLKKVSDTTLKERQLSLYTRALEFCNLKEYKLITKMEEIKTADDRVLYICPKHGIHETKIFTLIDKHGCIDCRYEEMGYNQRLSPDDVEEIFNKYNGKLLNKSDYTGWADKNLKVICPDCGKTFITSFGVFIKRKGQSCPECSNFESRGEKRVRAFLDTNKVKYVFQKRFDNCRDINPLPFDFYLPEYNEIIEYDGEQHYFPIGYDGTDGIKLHNYTINHDNIKNKFCVDNNIKLLRIPYWEFDNIEKILKRELIHMKI